MLQQVNEWMLFPDYSRVLAGRDEEAQSKGSTKGRDQIGEDAILLVYKIEV